MLSFRDWRELKRYEYVRFEPSNALNTTKDAALYDTKNWHRLFYEDIIDLNKR